jgi:hypothetical protein
MTTCFMERPVRRGDKIVSTAEYDNSCGWRGVMAWWFNYGWVRFCALRIVVVVVVVVVVQCLCVYRTARRWAPAPQSLPENKKTFAHFHN